MTRKDYTLIAATLAEVARFDVATARDARVAVTFLVTVEALADALGKENPRFNRDRFLTAVWGNK